MSSDASKSSFAEHAFSTYGWKKRIFKDSSSSDIPTNGAIAGISKLVSCRKLFPTCLVSPRRPYPLVVALAKDGVKNLLRKNTKLVEFLELF